MLTLDSIEHLCSLIDVERVSWSTKNLYITALHRTKYFVISLVLHAYFRMNSYQWSLIAKFFSQSSSTTQADCHKFVHQNLVLQLVSDSRTFVDVTSNLNQDSLSYTCVADLHHSTFTDKYIVIQFRHEKLDLWDITETHQLHESIVSLMLFQETYDRFFVYMSLLVSEISYVHLLTTSEESLSLDHRFKMTSDLANALTYKAQVFIDRVSLNASLSSIQSTVHDFDFHNKDLKRQITACISKIRQQNVCLAKLSLVLTHMNMTSFNYLVDVASERVTAILDWESVKYLSIEHNFHFVEHLFEYMTKDDWENVEDREALESFFYDRVRRRLILQRFDEKILQALNHEKTLETLMYYVSKLLEWKNDSAERCLERYLERYLQHQENRLDFYTSEDLFWDWMIYYFLKCW